MSGFWTPTRVGLLAGGGQRSDLESELIFAAFTIPPTGQRKTQINTLVKSLKKAGIWEKLDLLYVLAAADSQAARINWKAPGSFTAIAVNSPTFEADRGFTGDGSTSRLNTAFTPSIQGVNFVQNDASLWFWSRTESQAAFFDIGSSAGNHRARINPRTGSDTFSGSINESTDNTAANLSSVGFFGIQRTAGSVKRRWKNGVQLGTDSSQASLATADNTQWLLGSNSSSFSARQQSVGAWGASLTGLEQAFYNSMLTYMQAVGAA